MYRITNLMSMPCINTNITSQHALGNRGQTTRKHHSNTHQMAQNLSWAQSGPDLWPPPYSAVGWVYRSGPPRRCRGAPGPAAGAVAAAGAVGCCSRPAAPRGCRRARPPVGESCTSGATGRGSRGDGMWQEASENSIILFVNGLKEIL